MLEGFEAGPALTESEVKSWENRQIRLTEMHASLKDGERWLHKIHLIAYRYARNEDPWPERSRKLLMHRRDIDRLEAKGRQKDWPSCQPGSTSPRDESNERSHWPRANRSTTSEMPIGRSSRQAKRRRRLFVGARQYALLGTTLERWPRFARCRPSDRGPRLRSSRPYATTGCCRLSKSGHSQGA